MRFSSLSLDSVKQRLASSDGLSFKAGPFIVRLKTSLESLVELLHLLYYDFPVENPDGIADFHISLEQPLGFRRWFSPQVLFKIDGQSLFEPFPASHALPLFEWGLNWCLASRAHQYLLLHAAVAEKNGKAIVFPAFPGSGKSTLCAALALRGWRFFSDEFGMVRPQDGKLIPIPRPTPLKNESINVIQQFAPEAVIGPVFPKTRKGDVAHLRSPSSSVVCMDKMVLPGWIIFPRFQTGAKLETKVLPKPYALLKLATNAFNYEVLGETGFNLVSNMVKSCDCYDLTYSSLDEVIDFLGILVSPRHE